MPRIATPVPPERVAVTADEPEPAAVASHACSQHELLGVTAEPRAVNVSPVAVGVARVKL
jgi:hypothetical protein